jgi:hypothetical protein
MSKEQVNALIQRLLTKSAEYFGISPEEVSSTSTN